MSILEVRDVTYEYRDKNKSNLVLKGINYSFEQGKVYAITGPSGSGKTTLLSLLAGMDKPTSGKVLYNNKDLNDWNKDDYRSKEIAFIYQSFNLLSLYTVLENVSYPMELLGVKHKEAMEKAKDYLNMVGLDEEFYHRFPAHLSGGEQQRVAIARGLANKSKVLFADEATGNLDSDNGEKIVDIILDLAHKNNYLVILVTHDLDIARKTDEIIPIKDGLIQV